MVRIDADRTTFHAPADGAIDIDRVTLQAPSDGSDRYRELRIGAIEGVALRISRR